MKALVAGWFSYASGHATAGDLLARDVLVDWLVQWGIDHEIAVAAPFTDGKRWDELDPAAFTHAIFVCGPFGKHPLERHFLTTFAHCRLIGLDLSLDVSPDEWMPFDLLIERDSLRAVHPDMVFASRRRLPPVVGVCLVEDHREADVPRANAAITALLARKEAACVPIDTRLDVNENGLRTPGEVEALIGRVDMLVTTRLHGLVLSLKNGVPALVVDAVPHGGKLSAQCKRIGWNNILTLDQLGDEQLNRAFDNALQPESRKAALDCSGRAALAVDAMKATVGGALAGTGALEESFAQRQTGAGMAAFLAALPPPDQLPPPGRWARLGQRLRRTSLK